MKQCAFLDIESYPVNVIIVMSIRKDGSNEVEIGALN